MSVLYKNLKIHYLKPGLNNGFLNNGIKNGFKSIKIREVASSF
jgi:hypothetical protein